MVLPFMRQTEPMRAMSASKTSFSALASSFATRCEESEDQFHSSLSWSMSQPAADVSETALHAS